MAGMKQVSILHTDEPVFLDHDKISELEKLLGSKDAEKVIAKAMEEVAIRLSAGEKQFGAQEWKDLRKTVRSMGAIGDQIGMATLTRVCRMVVETIDTKNVPATAATFCRLTRIGDRSLSDYWDLQNVSG